MIKVLLKQRISQDKVVLIFAWNKYIIRFGLDFNDLSITHSLPPTNSATDISDLEEYPVIVLFHTFWKRMQGHRRGQTPASHGNEMRSFRLHSQRPSSLAHLKTGGRHACATEKKE